MSKKLITPDYVDVTVILREYLINGLSYEFIALKYNLPIGVVESMILRSVRDDKGILH